MGERIELAVVFERCVLVEASKMIVFDNLSCINMKGKIYKVMKNKIKTRIRIRIKHVLRL